jgi:septal ring factor EnvC (AmiA/AmiB activator)
LQELSNYRKEQALKIEELTAQLNNKLLTLKDAKTEKEKALNMKKIESLQLTNEKNKQTALVQNLKKQEKDLRKKLKDNQQKINSLNDKIAQLIAEEERKAAERARLQAQKSNKPASSSASSSYTLTKEEQLIAGNFERNKGRLPWPVEKGFISGKFGLQPHPVLTHVTTNNKGIYIQTEKNANARAVFEGEVTQRFAIPGNNYAVIIKHGNYRTVYSNLTSIYVKEGDHVTAKQAIGKIYTDTEDNNKTELYFMVWKDKELQNPELFLAK